MWRVMVWGGLVGWSIVQICGQGIAPTAVFSGGDFAGGAKGFYGASFYGRQPVNYVYAQPSGPAASMTATFELAAVPAAIHFLALDAMDDDAPEQCHIRISVNDQIIFEGRSGFPDAHWFQGQYRIPDGVLQAGTNRVTIANTEISGSAGVPPWFMLSRAAIGPADYRLPPWPASGQLQVTIPSAPRPFPEPLPEGQTTPGFAFRGIKGWNWDPEQYLAEIPFLKTVKMNFLMNCYLSLFSSRPPQGWANNWWEPLPESVKSNYADVIQACQTNDITFCFAMNPQLFSSRPLNETDDDDIDALYQHYAWAQNQGVRWFAICLDDVAWAGRGAQHAYLVNTVFTRLRQQDAEAQMIFCPGPYWGNGQDQAARQYLETLADELHPDVYVFWTGDGVVGSQITYAAAQSYRDRVQHRLFLWDNYPVNDMNPTLHLGPVSGRATNLHEVIDGYMGNPMSPQNEIDRLPRATCADYAYNPWAYDPARSIGQAILLLATNNPQRELLKELIELYPGFLVTGGGTGFNPVRNAFSGADAVARQALADRLNAVINGLDTLFPNQFRAARNTVANDLVWTGTVGGPRLVSAASVDGQQLSLVFTNGVDYSSATNPANYRLVGGEVLSGQWLPAPDTNVLVLRATDLNHPDYFALTASGIKDAQGVAGAISAVGPVADFKVANIGIGNTARQANAAPQPGQWLTYSRGKDIFGTNDSFNFVFREITGDFDLVLRIQHIGFKNEWTRGGLMARASLSADARNVMVGTYADGTPYWMSSWRATAGDLTIAALAPRRAAFPTNAWVRLKRKGSIFLSYCNERGGAHPDWTLVASNYLNLPAQLLVGMAASAIEVAGGGNAPTRFLFSDFGAYQPVGPRLSIQSVDGNTVAISWPTNAGSGFALFESTALGADANWQPATAAPALSGSDLRADVPRSANTMFYRLMRPEPE